MVFTYVLKSYQGKSTNADFFVSHRHTRTTTDIFSADLAENIDSPLCGIKK
jgi:hypothetical protein